MHITFDIDGVLADFGSAFVDILNKRHGLTVSKEAPRTWHWSDSIDGVTRAMEEDVFGAIRDDPEYADFWFTLAPLVTTDEVSRINKLSRRHVVTYLTNRTPWGQQADVRSTTEAWLRAQGLRCSENVYLARGGEKGRMGRMLGTQIAIEDSGENVVDYLDQGVAVTMLRRPYNESFVELVRNRGADIKNTLSEFLDLCWTLDARQEELLEARYTNRLAGV